MTKNRALELIAAFLDSPQNNEAADPFPYKGKLDHFESEGYENGDWMFWSYLNRVSKLFPIGFYVDANAQVIPFYGALGQFVTQLGPPTSREKFLGSARYGRYQEFAGGVAAWEHFEGANNLGYVIDMNEEAGSRPRQTNAIIAFFDLRDFTVWSTEKAKTGHVEKIQEIVGEFENLIQESFNRAWAKVLFVKGVGDGFMVVSEAELTPHCNRGDDVGSQHALNFCEACAEVLKRAPDKLSTKFDVGCGITSGSITRLFILGRLDFLGAKVNEASKLQSKSRNQVVIDETVFELLEKSGFDFENPIDKSYPVALSPESLLKN